MENLQMDSIIVRKTGIIASDMDGETVMMNVDTGKYYNLGRTGGRIWNLIENPVRVEKLIEKLMESYNVTKEQCEKDVLPFLQKIQQCNLIQICG
jgi:Tfp pilus assembly protein PilP